MRRFIRIEEVVAGPGAALPNILRHCKSASSEISKHDGSSDGVVPPLASCEGKGLYVKESKSVSGIQAVATSIQLRVTRREEKVDTPHKVRTSSTEISKPAFEITIVACYRSVTDFRHPQTVADAERVDIHA
jgi:hypothetical protein